MTDQDYADIRLKLVGWLSHRISGDEVEDIVQHSLLKYFEKEEEVLQPQAYIFQCARYRVADFFRHKDRKMIVGLKNNFPDPKGGGVPEAHGDLVVAEICEALDDTLPPAQAEIIREYIEDHATFENNRTIELAEKMGRNVNASKALLHRARNNCKILFARYN